MKQKKYKLEITGTKPELRKLLESLDMPECQITEADSSTWEPASEKKLALQNSKWSKDMDQVDVYTNGVDMVFTCEDNDEIALMQLKSAVGYLIKDLTMADKVCSQKQFKKAPAASFDEACETACKAMYKFIVVPGAKGEVPGSLIAIPAKALR